MRGQMGDDSTERVELLPCPFCGGEARSRDYGRERVSVGCLNMDCRATSMLSLPGEDAIAAWNTRAATKVIDRLRRCLLPLDMAFAQAEMAGEPIPDNAVVLHFMGSGASDQVTAGEIRQALSPPVHSVPE